MQEVPEAVLQEVPQKGKQVPEEVQPLLREEAEVVAEEEVIIN